MLSSTKHCDRCNACIETFDHHSEWLGVCVGRRNRRTFIVLLVSCSTYFLFFISMWTVLILAAMSQSAVKVTRATLTCACVLLWTNLILDLVAVLFLVKKTVFFVYLSCKQLTSYQFHLNRRVSNLLAVNKPKRRQKANPSIDPSPSIESIELNEARHSRHTIKKSKGEHSARVEASPLEGFHVVASPHNLPTAGHSTRPSMLTRSLSS